MTTDSDDGAFVLPEYRDNPFVSTLPPILSIADALQQLTDLPSFDEAERRYPAHLRAHCVLRLGRYFDPLDRHLTLESRFSMLIRQGYIGRNPANGNYVRRLQNAHDRLEQKDLNAVARHTVEPTANGFAIVGCSGIGKSRGIERVLNLYPQIIHHSRPFSLERVVWLKLDCPHKGSPKQLCITFFAAMDTLLGTRYQRQYGASRSSVDEMMVRMAHVVELHALGVLVVDEIQHLRQAPGASRDDLLNFLVTLVNTIGIPVVIIGTLSAIPLLQGAFRQARRASGMGSLTWERLLPGAAWNHFVERMWTFQWTREVTPLTDDIRHLLYEETQGIVDLVVKLFMLAQLHAIQLGALRERPEELDAGLLRHVARENFKLVAPMIEALRTNNLKALVLYDDLRPLHDLIQQALDNALTRLSAAAVRAPSQPPTPLPVAQAEDSVHALAMKALQALGVEVDVAGLLLSQAHAEAPGLNAMDLMGRVLAALQDRGSRKQLAKPRGDRKAKAAPSAPLDPDDLRFLAGRAKAEGRAAHVVFAEAGAVKPPLVDFAA